MASIDRICHMLLLTIFLICFSFLMQARRDRWETKVCDKPFHDGIISCMCVCCRSLLVLLSFSFWPLCCLFFFDIRIRLTLFSIFKLFLCDMGDPCCVSWREITPIVVSVFLRYTDSDYTFNIFKLFLSFHFRHVIGLTFRILYYIVKSWLIQLLHVDDLNRNKNVDI
jgi:hypothetical protein